MSLSEVDRLTRRIYPDGHPFSQSNNHNYAPPVTGTRQRLRSAAKWIRKTGERGLSGLRVATAPALQHVQDHAFTIAAIACFDWSAFLWNERAGLITTGIAFILYELKVSSS